MKVVHLDNQIKYVGKGVLNGSMCGWLPVKTLTNGQIYIPYALKVNVLKNSSNFQTIEICEGVYKGHIGNCEYEFLGNRNISFFQPECIQSKQIDLKLETAKNELFIETIGKTNNISISENIRKGRFKMVIPHVKDIKKLPIEYFDEKHGGSRFSQTWFQFVPENAPSISATSTFIHFGKYSEGCITFIFEKDKKNGMAWNRLYQKLITARLNDLYLGTLIVE